MPASPAAPAAPPAAGNYHPPRPPPGLVAAPESLPDPAGCCPPPWAIAPPLADNHSRPRRPPPCRRHRRRTLAPWRLATGRQFGWRLPAGRHHVAGHRGRTGFLPAPGEVLAGERSGG